MIKMPENKLHTQADAVLHLLQNLDIEMLDAILEEEHTYQDMNKSVFIQKLGIALDKFMETGDTYLRRFEGHCNSEFCNYKCRGFSFIGNSSGNYMDLVVDIKDGVVHDMYECSEFAIHGREVKKRTRINIDKRELPF